MSTKRFVATIIGALTACGGIVLGVLSVGTRQQFLENLADWLGFLYQSTAWAFGFVNVPAFITLLGVCIGLWAWDVHKRAWAKLFGDPNDPRVLANSRKKKVRAQVTYFFQDLYNGPGRQAVGALCQQAEVVARGLGSETLTPIHRMSASLLAEYLVLLQSTVQPVLNSQRYETDDGMNRSLEAWGELFFRYQRLAHYVNEAYKVCARPPWNGVDYEEWRKSDAIFITRMRDAEHMEDCERLSARIRDAGWGDEDRPPDTQTEKER